MQIKSHNLMKVDEWRTRVWVMNETTWSMLLIHLFPLLLTQYSILSWWRLEHPQKWSITYRITLQLHQQLVLTFVIISTAFHLKQRCIFRGKRPKTRLRILIRWADHVSADPCFSDIIACNHVWMILLTSESWEKGSESDDDQWKILAKNQLSTWFLSLVGTQWVQISMHEDAWLMDWKVVGNCFFLLVSPSSMLSAWW